MDSTFNVTQYSYSLLTSDSRRPRRQTKYHHVRGAQPECADDIAEVLQVFDTHVNELKRLAAQPS
jgi:hypothetical protein